MKINRFASYTPRFGTVDSKVELQIGMNLTYTPPPGEGDDFYLDLNNIRLIPATETNFEVDKELRDDGKVFAYEAVNDRGKKVASGTIEEGTIRTLYTIA
ncbi:MAG: hypothetical protein QE263_09060 [Vampirovibrionales bacterium]|nr:hypothetical protein [Vampirovibrionales bacterium]